MGNKQVSASWDQVQAFAEEHGGVLVRDGDRFNYRWDESGRRVSVWVAEDAPRFGFRMDPPAAPEEGTTAGAEEWPVSFRAWNLDTVERVLDTLTR